MRFRSKYIFQTFLKLCFSDGRGLCFKISDVARHSGLEPLHCTRSCHSISSLESRKQVPVGSAVEVLMPNFKGADCSHFCIYHQKYGRRLLFIRLMYQAGNSYPTVPEREVCLINSIDNPYPQIFSSRIRVVCTWMNKLSWPCSLFPTERLSFHKCGPKLYPFPFFKSFHQYHLPIIF